MASKISERGPGTGMSGEDQEKVADKETLVLLKRFSRNPDVEKASAEFERAQKVEERFHRGFDGIDFTSP